MLGELGEQRPLPWLVVDRREKEDHVELLVRQLPPGAVAELGVGKALAGAVEEAPAHVDADDAARALAQRLAAEEALVATDVEHGEALERQGIVMAVPSSDSRSALSFSADLEPPLASPKV